MGGPGSHDDHDSGRLVASAGHADPADCEYTATQRTAGSIGRWRAGGATASEGIDPAGGARAEAGVTHGGTAAS